MEEEEAAYQERAEQHRADLGADQCRGGADSQEMKGVQGLLLHHQCVDERPPRAPRGAILCAGKATQVQEQDLRSDLTCGGGVLQSVPEA